jgi:hypothetical protein
VHCAPSQDVLVEADGVNEATLLSGCHCLCFELFMFAAPTTTHHPIASCNTCVFTSGEVGTLVQMWTNVPQEILQTPAGENPQSQATELDEEVLKTKSGRPTFVADIPIAVSDTSANQTLLFCSTAHIVSQQTVLCQIK